MIQGGLVTYINFVKTKALAVAGVNKFLYGNADEIIKKSRSNKAFGYPLVHLARPVVVAENNGFGNQTTVFFTEIAALAKVDKSGLAEEIEDKELDAESLTLNILLELERVFRVAHDDIQFELTTEIEPTLPGWIDSVTGWRMSCKITLGPNSINCF